MRRSRVLTEFFFVSCFKLPGMEKVLISVLAEKKSYCFNFIESLPVA